MPIECTSTEANERLTVGGSFCSGENMGRVGTAIRKAMTRRGHTIINAWELAAETMKREDVSAEVTGFSESFGRVVASGGVHVRSGSTLLDVPPAAKIALMKEAKADGVIEVLIAFPDWDRIMGGAYSEATIRVGTGDLGERSRLIASCEEKSRLAGNAATAATECAINGVLPRLSEIQTPTEDDR